MRSAAGDARVALLTNFVPPYRMSLFEELAERLGALRVFVSTEMEPGRPWEADSGSLDVVAQKTWTLRRRYRDRAFSESRDLHVPLDTGRRLSDFSPDLIISGELGARTAAAVRYGKRRGIPVVVWATLSERTERDRGALRRWLRARLLGGADHVIVNGGSGERYIRRYGVAEARISRVPYTTDMTPYLQLPLERPPSERLRVLSVGSLSARKAPLELLEGARRAANPDCPLELVYVGDGPLREALSAAAATLDPALSVRLVGSVPYGELAQHYQAADVLAFPTLADEWGLVVNEALAAGVPVLGSTASQAVEELVVDGRNGWIVEAGSVPAIEAGLARTLATTRVELGEMRSRARRSVDGLDPAAVAERIIDVVTRVRGDHGEVRR